MESARVVILSGRSLFAEGIALRLRQSLAAADLRSVDAAAPDAVAQVVDAQPTTIIMDGTDPDVRCHAALGPLLSALPALRIICVDPEQDRMQVVTSEQRDADQVLDLLSVIIKD
jgi:hypothetical protein